MASSSEELDQLSKEELIEHIKKQNLHIKQLKNVIAKKDELKKEIPKGREFDFSKYEKKHVALKFFYLGWNYDGFVEQESTKNTIEDHLFEALKKVCLIEDRAKSNYHRCGRTDKGVSAFSQVVSLDLRSKKSSTGQEEIKYCKILNQVLPKDIRCICSAEVDQQFSARFNCKSRTYKYYFSIGTLDLESMRKAGYYLVGEHDYRNFCKLDKTKLETNYIRRIELVEIKKVQDSFKREFDIYELKIKSSAFLWHQIRCIVTVLFFIGERKEEPELIQEMFDLTKFSNKPQYSLANELPLVLFDCEFDIDNWQYDEMAVKNAISSLNEIWIESAIRNAILTGMLQNLEEKACEIDNESQKYFVKDLYKNHKKFKDRLQCNMQLNEDQKSKLTAKLKHRLIDKQAGEIEFKKMRSSCDIDD